MAHATPQSPPRLFLKLLGTPEIRLGDSVVNLDTAKARALFFYLATTQQPHSRQRLVDLLWGEMAEAPARRNLTATLTSLRKVLSAFVVVEPDQIAFNLAAPFEIDVTLFHHHVRQGHDHNDMAALQTAIDLYHGEFLEGLSVKDAPVFEEWLFAEREQVREQMLHALQRLVDEAVASRDYVNGVAYAQRLLTMDPWREAAHRQLMILHAQQGKREAALAQFETCRRILEEEVGVEPEEETLALAERLQRPASAPNHNLPPEPNPFVGRGIELAQICQLLRGDTCRLLSLVGPGGTGKTRLAVEALRQWTQPGAFEWGSDFHDGLYFVPLAAIAPETNSAQGATGNTLVTAIGEAVGLSFHGSTEVKGQLLAFLKKRSLLLLCDNFEHLLTGRRHEPHLEVLTAILRHAPHVKVLVTSRERLNVQEEWALEIEGLPYPPRPRATVQQMDETGSTLEDALAYDAVTLFVQRAQQAQPHFTLTPAETPHVIRLCQLLEGMPLGLELAASWLRYLSCAEIVDEVEHSLESLTTRLHNVPERHSSLRAIFEYSYQRLTAEEQVMLGALALFRGSFDREAANRIAGARLPDLARLADKSLLRRVQKGRYEMHQLLRQYIEEKLGAFGGTPQHNAMRTRFRRHYLDFVREREAALRRANDAATLEEVWQEVDNVRQAWAWAVAARDEELLAATVGGLSRFYDVMGFFQEGEELFQQAVSHLHSGNPNSDVASEIVVRLRIEQARHLCRRGQGKVAALLLPRVEAQARQLQTIELEAMAQLLWAEASSLINDQTALHEHAQAALRLARMAARHDWEAEALRYCGIYEERSQQIAQAAAFYEQALECFRRAGDQRGASLALNNWGLAAFFQHRFEDAARAYEEARIGFEAIGDRWGQNIVLNNLGNLHFVRHNYEAARTAYRQGLILAHSLNDLSGASHLHHNLGTIACFLGLFDEAQEQLEAGLAGRIESGARLFEGFSQVVLGVLNAYRGRHANANAHFDQAVLIARELNALLVEASALTQKGHVLVQMEEIEAAHKAYLRALACTKEAQDEDDALEATAGLAEVQMILGARAEAQQLVEKLLPLLESETIRTEIDPFQIHLSCYRVLAALRDPRSHDVLEIAQRQLHERSLRIEDADLRQSYLHNIPSHHTLLLLAEQR